MDKSTPRILIVDDHNLIREGLKTALSRTGYSNIGEAASKKEAIASIASNPPEVIVLDLNLPDGSGLEIIAWVRNLSQSIGIVILTMSDNDEHLLASLQSGASAYVLKTAPIQEVVSAVVQAQLAPLSFSAYGLHAAISRKDDGYGLTSRELQVLALLPKGSTSSQIGSLLFVTEATIKSHLAHIYRKLNVENRTEAVAVAISRGLI
jgi:DNA-binding NarL/FixJ family response regulator